MISSEEWERAVSETQQDADRLFPDWPEANALYVESYLASLEKVVASRIGGEDFFQRFIGYTELSSSDLDFIFSTLNEEYEAYRKVLALRETHGQEEINHILNSSCKEKSWAECVDTIHWYYAKIVKYGANIPFATPEGDNRYRVNQSIGLWVVTRDWKTLKENDSLGIVDQVERVILEMPRRPGHFVRYEGDIYPIQSCSEFAHIIDMARRGNISFFSNFHRSPDYLSDIVPGEFICLNYD